MLAEGRSQKTTACPSLLAQKTRGSKTPAHSGHIACTISQKGCLEPIPHCHAVQECKLEWGPDEEGSVVTGFQHWLQPSVGEPMHSQRRIVRPQHLIGFSTAKPRKLL